jgi:hypothetical protein
MKQITKKILDRTALIITSLIYFLCIFMIVIIASKYNFSTWLVEFISFTFLFITIVCYEVYKQKILFMYSPKIIVIVIFFMLTGIPIILSYFLMSSRLNGNLQTALTLFVVFVISYLFVFGTFPIISKKLIKMKILTNYKHAI